MLEEWFSDNKLWERSDLADGDLRWVCLKGIPILVWNDQFFNFTVVVNGWFLEEASATVNKRNLLILMPILVLNLLSLFSHLMHVILCKSKMAMHRGSNGSLSSCGYYGSYCKLGANF